VFHTIVTAPFCQCFSLENKCSAHSRVHMVFGTQFGKVPHVRKSTLIVVSHSKIVVYCRGLVMANDEVTARLRQVREGNRLSAHDMADATAASKRTMESYMRLSGAPLPGLRALRKFLPASGCRLIGWFLVAILPAKTLPE